MNSSDKANLYHIVHREGHQGTRLSAGNQAEGDKYATGRNLFKLQLRKKLNIGTWNVRKLKEGGKFNTVCKEMKRCSIQILGISETNWNGQGSFRAQGGKLVIFSGVEENYSHGVAVVLNKDTQHALIGYSTINDRIIQVRLQAKPYKLSIIQCYVPASLASEEEFEAFYSALQETLDSVPNRDIKIIMGDMNAEVGEFQENRLSCSKFGLGCQNERGEKLIDFCDAKSLSIANTMFQHHPRYLYTWKSPDQKTRNQIDYIMISRKWIICVKDAKTRPSVDCSSVHQLCNVGIKLKLKKTEQPHHPSRLDFKTLNDDFRINVNNRFEVLLGCDLESKSPNDLWEVGKEIMVSTAKEHINKTKKRIENGSLMRQSKKLKEGDN